jgi:low temperature requirement protein LtrA
MKTGQHLKRMSGRDVNEKNRVSTPLELFFDLTFAVSLTVVTQQLSRLLAQGEISAALLSFGISMLSICWAWMNYAWFASAYDTDDWSFRLATMIHMVGVIVLTLGLPRLFESVEKGYGLDTSVMVLGYVIMRSVMIFLWLRAAKHDLARRRVLIAHATVVFAAQLFWTLLIFLKLPLKQTLVIWVALGCVEFVGPVLFYHKWGVPPWHGHHIAERYSLLTIIALGECVSGTVTMVNAIVEVQGWSVEPILIGTACIALTFGCWWIYFLNPFGDLLHARRDRAFGWGYMHFVIFSSIVSIGAGLQVAGKYLQGKSSLTAETTLAFTAFAVGTYISSILLTNYVSLLNWNWYFLSMYGLAIVPLAASLIMGKMNFSLPACLAVLAVAPFVAVIGYETNRPRVHRSVLAGGSPGEIV